jgi:hypothetical protein
MKAKHGAKERHASRGLMWQAWSKIKACIQRKEKGGRHRANGEACIRRVAYRGEASEEKFI